MVVLGADPAKPTLELKWSLLWLLCALRQDMSLQAVRPLKYLLKYCNLVNFCQHCIFFCLLLHVAIHRFCM